MERKPGYKLFAVRVPVELHRHMKALAVSQGVTMAKLVETALRGYVERHGPITFKLVRE